ncbi:Lrp/AsnC ligand binding domain-containing protein, partial [Enterococcus faecium]
WLKTLYRKRAVTWPFIFYTIIWTLSYLSFIKNHEKFLIRNYKISGEGCYLLECRFTSKKSMNSFLEQLNEYANYKLSIVID